MKKQISPGDRSTGKVVSVMVTAVKGVFPPELSLLGETMAHCYKEYHKISAFLGGPMAALRPGSLRSGTHLSGPELQAGGGTHGRVQVRNHPRHTPRGTAQEVGCGYQTPVNKSGRYP